MTHVTTSIRPRYISAWFPICPRQRGSIAQFTHHGTCFFLSHSLTSELCILFLELKWKIEYSYVWHTSWMMDNAIQGWSGGEEQDVRGENLELWNFREKSVQLWTLYRVSQKKGNPVCQWDIFIATQSLIKLYASLSRAFSLLSFDTKHMMISQGMSANEQFKLMHVKIELRRIIVLSWCVELIGPSSD